MTINTSEQLDMIRELGGIYDYGKKNYRFPFESLESVKQIFNSKNDIYNSSDEEEIYEKDKTLSDNSSCDSFDSRSSGSDIVNQKNFHREKSFDGN